MQATSASELFPDPRAIANENKPPRMTASSILLITLKWSGDHAR